MEASDSASSCDVASATQLPPSTSTSALFTIAVCMDGQLDTLASSSSTEESGGFTIKGAASHHRSTTKERKTVQETCSICLEAISERAVAVPCNHLAFDFLCLVSWLQERSSCPLCNATVTEVQYDFRSPEDYKRYRVPQRESTKDGHESSYERQRRRRGQDFVRRRAQRPGPQSIEAGPSAEDPSLERRRRVYRHKLFSLHVGANRISQHRDFTPSDFANSPELQRRARMFLRRELKVFSFLDSAVAPRGGNREFLLEYVVAVLKSNELKGANGHAENLLADYLGRENAGLLSHELEAWLRSPYSMLGDWDEQVQYADAGQKQESSQR